MPIGAIQSGSLGLLSSLQSGRSATPSASDILGLAASAQESRLLVRSGPSAQNDALRGLSQRLETLHAAASALNTTGLLNNAFAQRAATSSNPSAVSARVSAGAAAGGGATEASYSIEVSSLARAQVNTGTTLSSAAVSTVQSGTHSLELTVGGTSRSISYTVGAGANNHTVLTTLATAINHQGSGVTAEVVQDAGLSTGRLVLRSSETGTSNAFSLSDVSGDAVAALNLTSTTTTATDAAYTVGGVSKRSSSNTVYLDNARVEATLRSTTSSAVKVSVGPDTALQRSRLDDFVGAYNDLQSFARQNGEYFQPDVSGALTGFGRRNRATLSDVGVTQGSDGTLSVDSARLDAALQNDFSKVRAAFGGFNGVATRAELFAGNLRSTPSSELLRPVETRTGSAPALEALRESVLKGGIVNLFR